jgi:hypothetical protein
VTKIRATIRLMAHKHLNSILSIISLCIASLSLYLSVTTQIDDRSYKELMLRPNVQLSVGERGDFSVDLINRGLGPALVMKSIYYLNGECLSFSDASNISVTNYQRAVEDLDMKFRDIFRSVLWPSPLSTRMGSHASLPVASTVISVGQELNIFRLEQAYAREFSSRSHDLHPDTWRQVTKQFVQLADTLPLRTRYCSISGRFCQDDHNRPLVPCDLGE